MSSKQTGPVQQPAPPDKYEILCWGACSEDSPCSIHYNAAGKEKVAVTGDVVDDIPPQVIGAPGQEEFRALILGVHLRKVEGV
jgi:hypothetical protein